MGKMLVIVGRVHLTLTTDEIIVFQLPTNIYPRHTINIGLQHISGDYAATGVVNTNGSVAIRSRASNLTGNEWFYISATFELQ